MDGTETLKDKLARALADLWADFADVVEDNPRGAVICYVAGLVTMAVVRFVLR